MIILLYLYNFPILAILFSYCQNIELLKNLKNNLTTMTNKNKIVVNSSYTKDEKELLEQASKLDRRPLSSFIAKSAMDKAKSILRGLNS